MVGGAAPQRHLLAPTAWAGGGTGMSLSFVLFCTFVLERTVGEHKLSQQLQTVKQVKIF